MSNKALFIPELGDDSEWSSSEESSEEEEDLEIEVDLYGKKPNSQKWLRIGIYIILEGFLKVINKSDNYVMNTLFKGEYFGESSILWTVGHEYFGDLVVGDKGVWLLFIPWSVFLGLPIHEWLRLKDIASMRFGDMNRMVEWKYNESSVF